MKVAFFSNFMNHHQLYFCLEMQKRLGDGFTFVATEEVPEEQLKLGYYDLNHKYDFILNSHDSEENAAKAMTLAKECDVMIIGSAPEVYLQERMKLNKLSFRFNERPLKEGKRKIFNPHTFSRMYKMHTRYVFKNLYMLCASAYTKGDCSLVGAYPKKAFKWGYFPEVKSYDDVGKLIDAKRSVSILWCARLIDWKHPEIAVEVSKRLKADGYKFHTEIIGVGTMEEEIKSLITRYGLDNEVKLLGSMSPEYVRRHMEQSEIFLFTSDRKEGWGAVLNEAMNSACAVVASKAAGATPFLVKNGYNGYMCKSGDADDFYKNVKAYFDDEKTRKEVSLNAYKTMTELWNPTMAAERFIEFSEELLNGRKKVYDEGPLSYAKKI